MSNNPLSGKAGPDFASRVVPAQKALMPKKHAITNDYTILTKTLGVGVNGKVLECVHKATGERRALKVRCETYERCVIPSKCQVIYCLNTRRPFWTYVSQFGIYDFK